MCGIDEGCIRERLESYYRDLERETGGEFPAMEQRLAERMNAARFDGRTDRAPDGALDAREIDFILQDSGASGPGLFHGPVHGRVMETLDRNRDGRITAAEMRAVALRRAGR